MLCNNKLKQKKMMWYQFLKPQCMTMTIYKYKTQQFAWLISSKLKKTSQIILRLNNYLFKVYFLIIYSIFMYFHFENKVSEWKCWILLSFCLTFFWCTELTTTSTCVTLEVSCVDTYAHVSEFGHDPYSLWTGHCLVWRSFGMVWGLMTGFPGFASHGSGFHLGAGCQ